MKVHKSLIAGALFAASAFALPAQAATTLEYWTWNNEGDYVKVDQAAVERYQAAHPDVKVAVTYVPYADYMTKLKAALAAGQPPAIFQVPWDSGFRDLAASGKLALWVGGNKAVYDKYEAVVVAMGDQARYIGDIGAGSVAKLVHNMSAAGASALFAEAFTMGVKAGVEPLQLWEAIRQGAFGRMRSFEMLGTRFLPGKFDPPSFQMRLLNKDVQLALQLGREVGVPMRMCNLVGQELTEALNRGWGTLDSQAYLQLQNERAGIPKIEVPLEKVKAVQDAG